MSAPSLYQTIEQTGISYLLMAGFPSRAQLADALADQQTMVFCLFPHTYRSEQTQVQLRNSLRKELDRLHQPYSRCTALVMADPTLGDRLDAFDFENACRQALKQVTPRQPQSSPTVTIPTFGDELPANEPATLNNGS